MNAVAQNAQTLDSTIMQIDVRKALRVGAYGGLAAVFVSAIGMVERFQERTLVNPNLTLGYVLLLLIPLLIGYLVTKPAPPLEGMPPPPQPGPQNLVDGLITGLVIAASLVALMILAGLIDLREVFINVSPRLLDVLTFGQSQIVGFLALFVLSGLLGVAGSAMHLLDNRWRKPLIMAFVWVMILGLFQVVTEQILNTLFLGFVVDFFYKGTGGLSDIGAILAFAATFALYFYMGDRPDRLRRRYAQMSDNEQRRARYGVVLVAIIVLALLPLILGTFLSEILDLVGIFLLMGLGLNLVVGYAGLLDLGYVAFFAVGAYTTAVLTSPTSPLFAPQLTFWLALPFVVLAAAVAGILVGLPVLRMRGDYLAIVTLGFGEIARLIAVSDWFKPVLGGAQGILSIPDIPIGPIQLSKPPEIFYPILAFCLLAVYVSYRLQDSRIGRAWMAMREDEPVAEAMGINIVTAKLSAFVMGAIFAGFAGALFATKIGSIFPSSFDVQKSITVLILIIVGGIGSLPGVVVGALALVGLPNLLREFETFQVLIFGFLLIVMMLVRPEGLVPSKRTYRELHESEMTQDEWLKQQAEAESSST